MNYPKSIRATRSKRAPISYERMAILLAVAAAPIDKTRIAGQVLGGSVGDVVIKKSTAYYLIRELTNAGYIQASGSYTLTDKGYRTLHSELKRIEQQRRILKQRLHVYHC